jgi:NADH:ubiquinone oxidoreductase subunit 2 (subunit N)
MSLETLATPARLIAAMDAATPLMISGAAALGLFLTSLVLLGLEPRGRWNPVTLAVLAALAYSVAWSPLARPEWAPLAVGLVAAALARDRQDPLHAECALKLVWVLGPTLALSWAGLSLLTLATGTPVAVEQWAVLQLGLDPRFLWNTALPLALLAGLVLLGGAPFHFWVADVVQGVRPWLAAPVVVTLQVSGAAWLSHRLEGIGGFPAGRQLVSDLLEIAAFAAFAAGAATLLVQRRPERRVGTLASLNGALMLAALAAGRPPGPAALAAWAGHLALALAGASTVARYLPTFAGPAPGAPLFRRHLMSGIAGLYALASLAGVPGTPGAMLWLATARALAAAGRTGLLLILAVAWIAALTATMRQWRQAFGVAAAPPAVGAHSEAMVPPAPLPAPVPVQARLALWISAVGLAVLGAARLWRA